MTALILIELLAIGALVFSFTKAGSKFTLILLAVVATALLTAPLNQLFERAPEPSSAFTSQVWPSVEEATAALQSWVTNNGLSGEWSVLELVDGRGVIVQESPSTAVGE